MQTLTNAILALADGEKLLANAVTNARRRARHMRKQPHFLFQCVGGPLEGHLLDLSGPNTAVFALNGQRGHYTFRLDESAPTAKEARAVINRWIGEGRMRYAENAPFVFWRASPGAL